MRLPVRARSTSWLAALACATACDCPAGCDGSRGAPPAASTSPPIVFPPPLPALPPVAPTETDRFATSGKCDQCHLAGDAPVMHDGAGSDISPAYLWRSSMMAFAARDPFYLALVSEEVALRPGAQASVEALCTRCHAPAGAVEHEQTGSQVSIEELSSGQSAEANLGRDGVTCTLCHQIDGLGLGDPSSFGGGFEVGFDREMYGPHQSPTADPMQFFVGYTPAYADHVASSELCATCHTVITPVLDAAGDATGEELVEQAPYLEWLSSGYKDTSACGSCHVPTSDEDGEILSPIAKYPAGLQARQPFGQHSFVGGNAYMLGVLAANVEWTGSDVAAAELEAAAARSEAHLRSAATVGVASAALEGDDLLVVVEVVNRAGHKLPTGYPSRRVWIHLRAEDAGGAVVMESGAFDQAGAIVDGAGHRLDGPGVILPHRDEVEGDAEVQVYEAVPVDANDAPTHRALDAVRYAKDDRLLPEGFSKASPWIDWIAPAGVAADTSFEAGRDRVTYRIAGGAAVARVTVELLYQTVAPATLEALAKVPTPAAVRFSGMASSRAPLPIVIASTEAEP